MELGNRPAARQGAKPNAWTAAEDAVMHQHYPVGGWAAVEPLLPGRSRKGVYLRAATLNLHSHLGRGKWTPAEDAVLVAHYTDKGAAHIAEQIGRTVLSVRYRASFLGIQADRARAGRARVAAVKREKVIKGAKNLTYFPPKAKRKPTAIALQGEARITSATKITIAPPFVDRRFLPDGPVPSVVDSGQCRDWARAA
jgi:hypothetical protein